MQNINRNMDGKEIKLLEKIKISKNKCLRTFIFTVSFSFEKVIFKFIDT